MLPTLVLSLALSLGQADATPTETPAAPMPERWLFMNAWQGTWPGWLLDSQHITVSGWTDASFTASSADHSQLPMGFNYRANEFLLQQNWLRIESPALPSGSSEPSFGFRSDTILPGSDYRFTLARSIFNSQLTANNGQPNLYGIDPIQFYAEAFFPGICQGLEVNVGRFFSPYGFEENDAINNSLLSHSYTFIYDPFTNTGILATLNLTKTWTVDVGLVLGSDIFIDRADVLTGVGSVKWAPPDGRDSVLLSMIVGPGRFNRPANFNNPNIFDLVYTHEFSTRLTYDLEALVGYETNVPNIGNAYWLSCVNYLTYQFAPRLSGTTRLEFFDDAQGQRTGFAGLYTAITAGLSFKPMRSITIRPELRYDYNSESRPFENRHGLFTVASDVILRW